MYPVDANHGKQPGAAESRVDVVIPAYNEKPEKLEATLRACQGQTKAAECIFVVDDGSRTAVALPASLIDSRRPPIRVIRLEENQGISAARNLAIGESRAEFVACINVEVLPQDDWMQTCLDFLLANPKVGACYTRTDPIKPDSLLSRWRMRFNDAKFPEKTGPSQFAHGHAVLFRRGAIDQVGGYDVQLRVSDEDFDITQRLWKSGWEVYFLDRSRCVSIQDDTLKTLAMKQFRDQGWKSAKENSLLKFIFGITRWTLVRAGRNVVKLRFYFLPVDVALWAYSIWLATCQKVNYLFGRA